ncbi:transglycosylase SLT domain-containing protein [Arthrobacter sp. NPDC092385]|uniref:transglycosylase SLT domain-containing protein n=1 Tax=Arthrobacter sp. NPDC092385 TaxID=3363943 RepID=UPI0038255ADF
MADEETKGSGAMVAVLAVVGLVLAGLPVAGVGAVAVLTQTEERTGTCSITDTGTLASTPTIPNGWGPLVEAAAETAGLPVSVVAAQLKQESGWNEGARSPVGAQGVAQFMPGTWAMYGDGGDPFSAEDAIPAYGRYMAALKEQVQSLAGDDADLLVKLTLAAYNAGPGAVQNVKGVPPFTETVQYIEKILNTGQNEFTTDCAAPAGGVAWDGDLGDGEWTTPLPGGVFTSGYGHRGIAGLPAWAQEHVGVDISTPGAGYGDGGQVIAPTKIQVTSFLPVDGCVIAKVIEEGEPAFKFGFCHLNRYDVQMGDVLERGDIVGIEGNRAGLGRVATHLHFEIYSPESPDAAYPYNNFNLDPEPILKEKGAWVK